MNSLADSISALQRHPSPIDIFAEMLRPELVEEALHATGSASIRRRKMPAEQVVWLMVGLALFGSRSIKKVFDTLDLQINGAVVSSTVSDARKRLGAAPMAYLFRKIGRAWTKPDARYLYKGLSLFGIDGTTFNVADSDENDAFFGRPGSKTGHSAYPQARLLALLDLNVRVVRAAQITALKKGERASAKLLQEELPHDSICLMDRGFASYGLFGAILKDDLNRHFLCRVRHDNAPRILERLADGSCRIQIEASTDDDKVDSDLPHYLTLRRIEYRVEGCDDKIYLYTSLLNEKTHPAVELAQLYHKRWEIEVAFDELKTEMLLRKEALRSKRPDGVEQEIWSMLLTYNLVRREMALAAAELNVLPARIGFKYSLIAVHDFFLLQRDDPSTGRIPFHLGQLRKAVCETLLPPRKSERSNPRCVKIKMSGYNRKGDRRAIVTPSA